MPVSKSELYQDISRRIANVRSQMGDAGFDALIVYGNTGIHGSLQYLTDYFADHGTTMVDANQETHTTDGAALLLTPDNEPALLVEPGLVVPKEIHTDRVVAGGWDPNALALTGDSVAELLEEEGITNGTVGIETFDRFPAPLYRNLDDAMDGVEFVPSRLVEEMRYAKTDVEIEIIREAAELAEKGHRIVVEELQDYDGKSELDIVHTVEQRLLDENPEYTSFKGPAYLNSGNPIEHARYYHGRDSELLTEGSVFTWDLPQHYMGYYVDTSRSRVLGEPTDEHVRGFEAARQAYEEVIDMARPGVNAKDMVSRYHEILDDAGFEPPFGGLLGHGVGLELHERPDMVLDDIELEENMVLAIEPRALVDDDSSVIGLEDMIRVTESGGEVLTGFERDTIEL